MGGRQRLDAGATGEGRSLRGFGMGGSANFPLALPLSVLRHSGAGRAEWVQGGMGAVWRPAREVGEALDELSLDL